MYRRPEQLSFLQDLVVTNCTGIVEPGQDTVIIKSWFEGKSEQVHQKYDRNSSERQR